MSVTTDSALNKQNNLSKTKKIKTSEQPNPNKGVVGVYSLHYVDWPAQN